MLQTQSEERASRSKQLTDKRHKYVAEASLTSDVLEKMMAVAEQFVALDYDLYFEWSDERTYCSELVWKIYEHGAGIELGNLQRMKDFDFSHPAVQEKIRERFGVSLPLEQAVISPEAIFSAPNLETVYEN
jgi:hypothetical protein